MVEPICIKPQIVKLKEEVEEEINEWDLIPVKNQDPEVTACTGSRYVLFILCVLLLCKQRKANHFKTDKIKMEAFNQTQNYNKDDFGRKKKSRRKETSPSNKLQASNQLDHCYPTSSTRKAAKERKERERMEKENKGFFQKMFFGGTNSAFDNKNMSL